MCVVHSWNCDFRLAKVPARDHAPGAKRAVIPFRNSYPRYGTPTRDDLKSVSWHACVLCAVGTARGEIYKREHLEK